MQRYALMDQPAEMHPDETGEWVRYEDAVAAIAAERESTEQRVREFRNHKSTPDDPYIKLTG